jgi:hypothetical protein
MVRERNLSMVRERNEPKQACRERNLSMVRERNLNKVPERVLTTTPDPPFMNTISIISRILVQLQMHLCCVFSQCSNLKRLQECQFIICYKFHKKNTSNNTSVLNNQYWRLSRIGCRKDLETFLCPLTREHIDHYTTTESVAHKLCILGNETHVSEPSTCNI